METENKSLLETYSKRLAVSESVAAKAGVDFDSSRKMAVAMVLNNTNKYLNEKFSNSVGTQRADLGAWKKFCLNLTTVALPTLIAPELVIVNPMSSFSGYVTYIEYTAGTTKGQTKAGKSLNSVFGLGDVDVNYTASRVVETVSEAGDVTLAWTPVVTDAFKEKDGTVLGDVKFIPDGGEVSYLKVTDGKVKVTGAGKIAYEYDNEVIPQNDLPILNAKIKSIPLICKTRRIAIYYSQIAAFQAKQDYGFDLGDQLAEKACGELTYEIDTEITNCLIENAAESDKLTWSRTVPQYISKAEHYEGFAEVVDIASSIIYERTKRFAATFMLCARDIINILTFIKGFKAADAKHANGPYFAGTLNGIKVFVTPGIEAGKFVLGCNGDDMMSAPAVYAPYMAVVPTQLLGMSDGAMSQGFSTVYALEMLNKDLLVAGKVTTD